MAIDNEIDENLMYFLHKISSALSIPSEYLFGIAQMPSMPLTEKKMLDPVTVAASRNETYSVLRTTKVPARLPRTIECPTISMAIEWANSMEKMTDGKRYLVGVGPLNTPQYCVVNTLALADERKKQQKHVDGSWSSFTSLKNMESREPMYDGLTLKQCFDRYVGFQRGDLTPCKSKWLTASQLKAASALWSLTLANKVSDSRKKKEEQDRKQIVCQSVDDIDD